jgi:hypothetical protein
MVRDNAAVKIVSAVRNLALLTLLVSMSPAAFADDTVYIALSAPGIRNATDPAVSQAVDYLVRSEKAAEIKTRRRNTKPAFDGKVVKHRFNTDKVLIMGGSDVVPM